MLFFADCVYRAIFAWNVHLCKTLSTSNDSPKNRVRLQLTEASVCVLDELLSSSYASLSVFPHCAVDLPLNITNLHSHTHTHSAGQVGAAVRETAFHLDPRKAEARVQLIGFQRVNEKGNRKIESDKEREREREREREGERLCVWWREKENEGNSER